MDQKSVIQYEYFINDKLKSNLKKLNEAREKINGKIENYVQTKDMIQTLQANDMKEIKIRTDIGCNFYMKAKIKNAEYIYIDIGLGLFAQMKLNEAASFIDKKVKLLDDRVEVINQDMCKVSALIRLYLNDLAAKQGLED
ncbi:unnamed protein product [Gordionus sp. m RMFG-2023]|uniref:protein UXT-like isoform X2 n=1 Tax=Gordionus sp. m RMFG-2023 TaxID=3053472 RepID=UPI0030E1D372